MSDTATAGHRLLGPDDEPQDSGAAVAVHWGDYRAQEIWVRSGSNIGAWYPLGGEHWVVWDRKRMPAGVTKQHPEWRDVLARGPVTLLVPADGAARRNRGPEFAELVRAASRVTYVMEEIHQAHGVYLHAGGRRYHSNLARNDWMVQQAHRFVVWDPASRGTAHCLAAVRRAGLPYDILSTQPDLP